MLYFYSNRDGRYDLWSIRADGSCLTRITQNGIDTTPNASPDGKTLVVSSEGFATLVHTDAPVGSRLERIGTGISRAKWSADGRFLVGAGSPPGIAVYSLDTKRVEKVLDRGVDPQWLPDSKRIVFFDKDSIGVLDLESFFPAKDRFALAMQLNQLLAAPGFHAWLEGEEAAGR